MDRGEPTLAPEWLKAAGSSSHSDEHNTGILSRNRLTVSVCDHDAPRASSLSFRRSSSSNGSMGHDKDSYAQSRAYGSFGTNHRGRDRDKDRDRQRDREKDNLLDNGYCDYPDSSMTRRIEKDTLRRSHSMVSGRRAESLPKRPGSDSSNGVLSTGSLNGGFSKVSFEREFPSLGADEKQGASDAGRMPSPGLSTAINSLHISTSAVIGGDGWTSALAEVPAIGIANGSSMSSALQTAANMVSTGSGNMTGLSMAETLAQAPSRARTAPPTSNENERRKEMTLKQQYNKLIPVLNSSEKSKTKGARNGDLVSPKVVQQPSPQLANAALRLSGTKSDILKTPQAGNFLVLNRERNSVSPTAKDGPPLTTVSRVPTSLGGVPSASVSHLKSTANPKLKANGLGSEKKPQFQAQDRNHFFNSLRKQAEMKNGVSHHSELSCGESSFPSASPPSNPVMKSDEQIRAVSANQGKHDVSASGSGLELVENGNSNACDEESETFVAPDEEEKAFLKSLGWNENASGGGLTDEEILSFVKKHEEKLRPDFKYRAGLPDSRRSGSC